MQIPLKNNRLHMLLSRKSYQRGFVMITVLIFMVILMIVAIAAMRSTKSEVAVAGSRYFRNQAFQQSQSTLILTERCISVPADCALAAVPKFDGTEPGWLNKANNFIRSGANGWIGLASWAAGYSGANDVATDAITGVDVSRQPQYAAEKFSKQTLDGGSISEGSRSEALSLMQPYRLTARTQNTNDGSTVLLQRHIWTLAE